MRLRGGLGRRESGSADLGASPLRPQLPLPAPPRFSSWLSGGAHGKHSVDANAKATTLSRVQLVEVTTRRAMGGSPTTRAITAVELATGATALLATTALATAATALATATTASTTTTASAAATEVTIGHGIVAIAVEAAAAATAAATALAAPTTGAVTTAATPTSGLGACHTAARAVSMSIFRMFRPRSGRRRAIATSTGPGPWLRMHGWQLIVQSVPPVPWRASAPKGDAPRGSQGLCGSHKGTGTRDAHDDRLQCSRDRS